MAEETDEQKGARLKLEQRVKLMQIDINELREEVKFRTRENKELKAEFYAYVRKYPHNEPK